jgi:hypothetical protein
MVPVGIRLKVLVRLAQAARVTAAAATAVSVLAFGAGPGRAAAGARPIGGGVESIWCFSAGQCTGVGFLDFRDRTRPLVVSETNGAWGSARTIPGLSALPIGDHGAGLGLLSCPSAGNCTAGGDYAPDGSDETAEGLVVSERNGVWGKAEAVPGLAALNIGKSAGIEFLSCPSAGNCAAAGIYETHHINDHAFVVSEKNGAWGTAEPIPGLPAADSIESAVDALSCSSPGNCLIAGRDGVEGKEFLAVQKNGVWGAAQAFPVIGKEAGIFALSCWPDGTCTAAGADRDHFFTITRTRGTWSKPELVPSLATLPGGNPSAIDSTVSCPSPGNCTLGGEYVSEHDGAQLFTASQKDGTWGQVRQFPGLAARNTGQYASLDGLVCFSAGNCTAAGDYTIQHKGHTVAAVFVTTEKNGTWAAAERVPGSLVNLGTTVELGDLSCGASGNCSIGGSYHTKIDDKPFVDTQKNGTWAKARLLSGVQP